MKHLRFIAVAGISVFLFSCKAKNVSPSDSAKDEDGYVSLYNGKDMGNWNIMCRDKTPGLAEKVFSAGDNGEMHVYKNFPDGDRRVTGKNGTHCMFFTKEKYSRYSFKFEYKWGDKVFNNYDKFQYDAGMYFHVFDVNIWPKGLEYQVRYDDTRNENHTGCVWNSGASFDWYGDNSEANPKLRTYLSKEDGGVAQEHRGGEHKAHKDAEYHALDGQWNQCEVIVMGKAYAIYKLNGKVVNVLTNLSHSEGEIGLQAETAEIFYRNIKIKVFDETRPMKDFLR
ncbi:DUF1080 domain-containing protein [Zobellia galactanivorans]|uniref:Conserved hypothetical membrane protein n=1 Tax=Zobellia galactanivorans (strain DSM 12802 / CCUG 47099 / CIP 106680 / NCIMB 13871 / Dsij) TaxID=63186 RepID=G0L846_ZOBGA|nr:DUF1080 domain-containing protein [Zobellia galactanivorans]MBU3024445.1 DUF1080 domain-containing protein [Zobellia galactanivorans]MDO6807555.1 DUF1080 domain-containing protein [Zobellia galactanivorans]CAZ97939.1 Conserved hypothetical membrane protein [Zobellia galactanivorans]